MPVGTNFALDFLSKIICAHHVLPTPLRCNIDVLLMINITATNLAR